MNRKGATTIADCCPYVMHRGLCGYELLVSSLAMIVWFRLDLLHGFERRLPHPQWGVLSVELTRACCFGSDSTVAWLSLSLLSFNFDGLETVFPFYGAVSIST